MIRALALCTCLAFYLEVVLQLYLIVSQRQALHFVLSVLMTSSIVISVIATNLVSVIVILTAQDRGWKGRERSVCLTLHGLQLGLVWRVYRVFSCHSKVDWIQLTSLRLIYLALTSFPYLVTQSRLLFVLDYEDIPLPVTSLVVSLCSCSVALCDYTLRHRLGEDTPVTRASSCSTCSGKSKWRRCTLLLLGTCLCLTTRVAAFTLLSVEHGLWVILPFTLHFLLHAVIGIGHSALSSSHRHQHQHHHHPSVSNISTHTPSVIPNSPIPKDRNSRDTPDTLTTHIDDLNTSSVQSSSKSAHRWNIARRVAASLAGAYLNTIELAEERVDSGGEGVRCRYVLYYSLTLVENLAMMAAWLLHSPLDYAVKLVVAVVVLATFMLGLLFKVFSCGCVIGAPNNDGPRAGEEGLRGAVTVFVDRDTASMGEEDGSRRNTTVLLSAVTSEHGKGREFLSWSPKQKCSTDVSLATVSCLSDGDKRHCQTPVKKGLHRWLSQPEMTPTSRIIKEALKQQQNLAVQNFDKGGKPPKGKSRTNRSFRTCSADNVLVAEDHQRHLPNPVSDDDNCYVCDTSLRVSPTLLPDGCSFDDPIMVSRLVIQSLGGRNSVTDWQRPRNRENQRASGRGSSKGHVCPRDLVELIPIKESDSKQGKFVRTGRLWRASDTMGSHREDIQYSYVTRCSCRGSPSSTPRRRPGKHPRKTHSHGSAHHAHHHKHHRRSRHHRADHHLENAGSRLTNLDKDRRPFQQTAVWQKTGRASRGMRRKPIIHTLRPPSPTPLHSDTSVFSSTSSGQSSRHRRPPSRHRQRDSRQGPASWPRRQRQTDGGRETSSASKAVHSGKSRPAMSSGGGVSAQDIVRLWLQGLHQAAVLGEYSGNARSVLQPGQRSVSEHSGLSESGVSVKSDDDNYDDDDEEEDDDDIDDETDESVGRGLNISDDTSAEEIVQSFQRNEMSKDSLEDRVHNRKCGQDSHNTSDSQAKRKEWRWADDKTLTKAPIVLPFTSMEQTLTCSGAATNSFPQHEDRWSARQNTDSAGLQSVGLKRVERGLQNVPVRTALEGESRPTKIKTGDYSEETEEMSSHNLRHHHTQHPPVTDSGVSFSTVHDSDGSRSNAQGHSKSNIRDFSRSRSKEPDVDIGAAWVRDESGTFQHEGETVMLTCHRELPPEDSAQGQSVHLGCEGGRKTVNTVVTLEVNESLV